MVRDVSDQFAGCLLGLGLADAWGAPYEGWGTEKTPWKPMPLTRTGSMLYTDDTDMALGSAESLVTCRGFDVDHMAGVWTRRAEPGRGYGGGAIRCLQNIAMGMPWREAAYSVYADGSFGNGAAMRVAPLVLRYTGKPEQMIEAVALASSVTHAHPIGIQGAQLIASAIDAALRARSGGEVFESAAAGAYDLPFRQRLILAGGMLGQDPDHQEVASVLGNGIAAHESVVSALVIACMFIDRPFAEMIGFVVGVGGDVDTIGAMSGAIWGAFRGKSGLPDPPLRYLEDHALLESYAVRIASLIGH